MGDIRTWPEVPAVAHFCSLFRQAFNLLDFDIEELEEALVTDGADGSRSILLQDLIIRLLSGCLQNDENSEDDEVNAINYQMYLRRLFREKCEKYGRENPFNTDIDFQFLPLRVKVEILHALCDFRLDAEDVTNLLKNLEADSLRVEPLGQDENKAKYWYFYGTRLYREDFPKARKKVKERKKQKKEDRRKRQDCDSDTEVEEPGAGVWQVVCQTEKDWNDLAASLKHSTYPPEQELYTTLIEDFLPELPRLFKERETTRYKKYLNSTGQSSSSGRPDDDNHSNSGRREGSVVSEEENEVALVETEKKRPKQGRPRQTNNSLSSATGQIFIATPKRKKLRSKQVFKTSPEDLLTGMHKILDYVKNQEDAWPFTSPVDEHFAPRYYSVIRRPMDLTTMEKKLDAGEYNDLNDFRDDFQLIIDNCRQYNGSENEYTEMATSLLDAFNHAIDRYLESDSSSDEDSAAPARAEPPKLRERKPVENKGTHSKKTRAKKVKKTKNKDAALSSGSETERKRPKQSRNRSPTSDGSIPGSDFDDREPEFLRDESPLIPARKKKTGNDTKKQRGKIRETRKYDPNDQNSVVFFEKLEHTLSDLMSSIESIFKTKEDPLARRTYPDVASPDPNADEATAETRPGQKLFRNPRDPVRRRKNNSLKRKDIRTIDRLQPGKSKGNLISNLPKIKEEESANSLSLSLSRAKESRNALLVKTDELGPKLSLGTVLKSDILDFGKNKHSFDVVATLDISAASPKNAEVSAANKSPVRTPLLHQKSPSEDKFEAATTTSNKENDPVGETVKETVVVNTDEKKRDGVKEITNKTAPNASAWFKAFGAPKAPAVVKKKPEVSEPPAEDKETIWPSASVPLCTPRRQRKASSSSSVSEPSSISQDSPLHALSPGIVSPRGEPAAPPVSVPLRVGFYQDMSSAHKSSPEKQSPHSTHSSPREVSNPSPFQGYSHVYPPQSPGTYANYTTPGHTPAPPPASTPQSPINSPHSPVYDSLPQYPPYTEQYKQPSRPVEEFIQQVPKPNLSNFPVKKRLYATVDMARSEPDKVQPQPQPEITVNRTSYSDERYAIDPYYQQRQMGHYSTNSHEESMQMVIQRMHPPVSEHHPSHTSIVTSQADLSRLLPRTMPDQENGRYHTEIRPGSDLADRGLNAMMEGLGRMSQSARGFPSPMDRLMQQPVNSIQEDSDGVFRNKYSADSGGYTHIHHPPNPAVSSAYPSTSLPNLVDRYDHHYYDKDMYLKNVSTSSPLPPIYQEAANPSQTGYELNIPKPREMKPVQKKKKAAKSAEQNASVGFQHYVGLKPTEPSVPPISLKTTSAVPGSAFNFGPGLSNPLYPEGYLDELRQPPYYGMVGGEKTPPFLAPAARPSYPIPQFMGHQPGLVDGYQQYLQRVQEEHQLRLAYQPGYHPALGMRPSFDRPSWL